VAVPYIAQSQLWAKCWVERTDTHCRIFNGAGEVLDGVAGWLKTSFGTAPPELQNERLKLCLAMARENAVAGCELRMLLAMEALQGSYFGKRKPAIVGIRPPRSALACACPHNEGWSFWNAGRGDQ